MIVKNLKSFLNWMMKPMGYANLQVSGHKLGTNKNHTISMNFIIRYYLSSSMDSSLSVDDIVAIYFN